MSSQKKPAYVLAIHGGAAVLNKRDLTPDREADYRRGLTVALTMGQAILEQGGSALDAVEAAVACLEDDPLFNAGRGASLTAAGTIELDAAIMDGRTLRAGAVAQLSRVRNPVRLARCILEKSGHVFLAGIGAENFAKEHHIELVSPDYFLTDYRRQHLAEVQASMKRHGGFGTQASPTSLCMEEPAFGTVGAVALDMAGNLAAATSTGGMTAKQAGRIGDSPVIGAGTFADNTTCAVSASGHGEWFIRAVVAYDLAARMAYAGKTVQKAADEVVLRRLRHLGGGGGLIALDAAGNLAMSFNTVGMYRASIRLGKEPSVAIY